MPSINITPPVAARLNTQLVACFDLGVKDGINRVWRASDGRGARPLPNILEAVLTVRSESASNIYTYAPSDYSLFDTDGDETPTEGVKMYQQEIVNGRRKKRVVRVDLTDAEDDKVGEYKTQFHTLGTASVVAPYRKLVTTMETADTIVTTIDDTEFFADDHPVRPKELNSEEWSNDLVVPTGLDFNSFNLMWETMTGFPGEDGYPVGAVPTKLAVGRKDFAMGMDICYVDKPSSLQGGGNRWVGLIELVYVPEWDDGTCMLLDDTSSIERAFIFQERQPVMMRPLFTSPEEPWVVRQDALEWRVDGRYEVGAGHPRRALRLRRG